MRILAGLMVPVLLLLYACSFEPEFSEREKALFTAPVFGYDIRIDSLETLEDLIFYFDKIYCEHHEVKKWPVLYFDLDENKLVNPQEGKNILSIGIEPSPCPDVMFEYDYTRILEVLKDGYNLEVEETRIEPDSLTPYISKQYLNFGKDPKYSSDPAHNGIWLISNKDDKLENLNKYLAQIIRGYVLMAREYSLMTYGKNLEEISDEEYTQLKKKLAFHLSFKYSDEPPQIKVGF
jgi:hypothetical protein